MADSWRSRAHTGLTTKEKIIFCWSGGKDSALALHKILQDDRYEVVSLLTTCNEHFQRVSMHGVRLELLEKQAASIGLPLDKMFVSQRSSNDEYLQKLTTHLLAGRTTIGFLLAAAGTLFCRLLKLF